MNADALVDSRLEVSGGPPAAPQRAALKALQRRLETLARQASTRIRPQIERFDAREKRERILMIVAALAAVVMVCDALWMTPAWRDLAKARAELAQTQQAYATLQSTVAALVTQSEQQRRQMLGELDQLRAQHPAAGGNPPTNAGAAAEPAGPGQPATGSNLIAASDMLPLLGKLMRSHPGIKVRAMQSLGSTVLGAAGDKLTKGANAGSSDGAPVYRHGVELTLEGGYSDLVSYLMAVENLPQRVLWGGLVLKADDHPRIQMTLRLYTLSLDRVWAEI